MAVAPLEQLSPELVLILPPEVAAVARLTVPDPGSFAAVTSSPPAAERVFSLERAATLAAVYAAVLAITVPPVGLMLRALPSQSHKPPLANLRR